MKKKISPVFKLNFFKRKYIISTSKLGVISCSFSEPIPIPDYLIRDVLKNYTHPMLAGFLPNKNIFMNQRVMKKKFYEIGQNNDSVKKRLLVYGFNLHSSKEDILIDFKAKNDLKKEFFYEKFNCFYDELIIKMIKNNFTQARFEMKNK